SQPARGRSKTGMPKRLKTRGRGGAEEDCRLAKDDEGCIGNAIGSSDRPLILRASASPRLKPLGPALLVRRDFLLVRQGHADLVEPFEQAGAAKGIDLEMG